MQLRLGFAEDACGVSVVWQGRFYDIQCIQSREDEREIKLHARKPHP